MIPFFKNMDMEKKEKVRKKNKKKNTDYAGT